MHSLKSERKRTGGTGEGSKLSLCVLRKECLMFEIANIVLSEKGVGIFLNFFYDL